MNKIFKTLNVSLYTKVTRQHLSNISKGIDELNSKYDNILTIGDLNSDMSASPLDLWNLQFKKQCRSACFKNSKNSSCIDLV